MTQLRPIRAAAALAAVLLLTLAACTGGNNGSGGSSDPGLTTPMPLETQMTTTTDETSQ